MFVASRHIYFYLIFHSAIRCE